MLPTKLRMRELTQDVLYDLYVYQVQFLTDLNLS